MSGALGEVVDAVFIRSSPQTEVAGAKTSRFQVATLSPLTFALSWQTGAMSADAAGELPEHLRGLPDTVQQVFDHEAADREVAESTADGDAFFFIGCRLGHTVPLELNWNLLRPRRGFPDRQA